ncbi:hypothetical protein J7K19_10435 [bacterium]|nr:hypothetical protein [bacterium]
MAFSPGQQSLIVITGNLPGSVTGSGKSSGLDLGCLVVIRQRAGHVDQMHHGSILVAKDSQQNTIGHSFRHE